MDGNSTPLSKGDGKGVSSLSTERNQIPAGPYRGIHPFRYGDRDLFFGRESTVRELLVHVLLSRLVILFGESGAGKSSLINAGLLPGLEKEDLHFEKIRIRPIPDEPILIEKIQKGSERFDSIFQKSQLSTAGDDDRFTPYSLDEFQERIQERCSAKNQPVPARIVLIFDQFEELFTLFAPHQFENSNELGKLQEDIISCIARIVTSSDLKTKALIVIREDFLGRLDVLAKRYPQVFDHRVRIGFFQRNEAERAILGPFEDQRKFVSRIDSDLAATIVKDLCGSMGDGSDCGVHPTQLQIICSQLWRIYAAKHEVITRKEYDAVGGVKGILEGFLQSELTGLGSKSRTTAIKALRALVTDGGTRDVVSHDRLKLIAKKSGQAQKDFTTVLDYLESRKLVYKTPQRNTFYYEIASEYLIPAIIKESQQLELLRENRLAATKLAAFCACVILVMAFGVWNAQRKASRDLKKSQAEVARQSNQITLQERDMVQVNEQKRNVDAQLLATNSQLSLTHAQLTRANKLLQEKSAALERTNALFARANEALRSRGQELEKQRLASLRETLALEALRLRGDPRAALLARQAFLFSERSGEKVSTRVDEALRAALSTPCGRILPWPLSSALKPTIWAVGFDAQKQSVIAAARDGSLYSWRMDTTAGMTTLVPSIDGTGSVALSSDGHTFARLSHAGIQVFRLEQLQNPRIFQNPDVPAAFLGFDNAGQFLLCGSRIRGTVLIWDLAKGGSVPRRLEAGTNAIANIAFSPDSKTIATADIFGDVRLWNAATPQDTDEPSTPSQTKSFLGLLFRSTNPGSNKVALASFEARAGRASNATAIAFQSRGDQLAIGSGDGTVQLWNITLIDRNSSTNRDQRLGELKGPVGAISCVTYSGKGRFLAAAGWDGQIRLWNLEFGERNPILLLGHQGGVSSIAFSPDEAWLISSGLDQTVRVWDLAELPNVPSLSVPSVKAAWDTTAFQAAVSADGSAFAIGNWDGTVGVLRIRPEGRLKTRIVLPREDGAATAVCLNSNGQYLAVGGYRGVVYLYEVRATNTFAIATNRLESAVISLALSRDDRLLAAGSITGSIRMWASSAWNTEVARLNGHASGVVALDIHRSGKQLVSGSWDGTLRWWNLMKGTIESRVLLERRGVTSAVKFSPDGTRMASGTLDGNIQLWQTRSEPVLESDLPGHDGRVLCLAFDQNGGTLVSGSWDESVRVWSLAGSRSPLAAFRGKEGRILAVALQPSHKTVCSCTPTEVFLDWIGSTKDFADQVCTKASQNLSERDWDRFVGGVRYEKTCGNLPNGEGVSALTMQRSAVP